jgi:hypothetical protein
MLAVWRDTRFGQPDYAQVLFATRFMHIRSLGSLAVPTCEEKKNLAHAEKLLYGKGRRVIVKLSVLVLDVSRLTLPMRFAHET